MKKIIINFNTEEEYINAVSALADEIEEGNMILNESDDDHIEVTISL